MDDHSQIRDATHHDLEGITQLEAEVFPNPWSLETFHGFLPTAAMLVATWEGTVVGYVLARALGGDEGEVLNIAVAVSVRRNRVGSGLLQRALDRLTAFGVQHTYLEVRESSFGAQGFYRRFGFRRVGRWPGYYAGPTEDALVFCRSVDATHGLA